MLISKSKKKKLERIVEKYYNAIIFKIAGPQDLTAAEKNELFEVEIISPHEAQTPIIEEAYRVGRVRNPEKLKYEKSDLNKFRIFDSRGYVPLTEKEKFTIAHVKESMGNYLTKLKDNARSTVEASVNNANEQFAQQTLMESMRSITEDNVKRRKGVGALARDLRDKTEDMNRDWERVASTEMSRAFNSGAADAIAGRNKGKSASDVIVVCYVSKDGALCEHCRKAYLMPSGEPKAYKLSTLRGNGTNYGKKASQWRPVIPPMHPNCRCSLVECPEGFGFKEGTRSPTFKGPDYDVLKEQKKEK